MTTNRCQHFSQKLDSLCYRIDVWRSARVVHRHEVLCHESVSRTRSRNNYSRTGYAITYAR